MDINSNDSYEEEFDSSDIPGKQSIFPTKSQTLIGLCITAILLVILEKLFISIFYYFIPSYFFLIITWILTYNYMNFIF